MAALPFWREILNESVAGMTDCHATLFCVALSYFLFTHFETTREYFYSIKHVYWVFYFVHVAIVGKYIWGDTFRNSVLYIYDRGHSQSRPRTLAVVLCQYFSVFLGAWTSCKAVEYVFSSDDGLGSELVFNFVGAFDFSLDWGPYDYSLFVWQTIAFQLGDRFVAGLTVTISPLLKRHTVILDGSWVVVTWRCLFVHSLIVRGRYSVVVNPNYSFYDCLYHWRWGGKDLITLFLPYICILIWNRSFVHLPFLFNPGYFEPAAITGKRTKKKVKKKRSRKSKKKTQ